MKLYQVTLTIINHDTGLVANQDVAVMATGPTHAEYRATTFMDIMVEKLRPDTEIEVYGVTELESNCFLQLTDEMEKYFNGDLTSDE